MENVLVIHYGLVKIALNNIATIIAIIVVSVIVILSPARVILDGPEHSVIMDS